MLKFMTTRLPSVYIYMYPRLYTLVARVKRSVLNGYTSSPGILYLFSTFTGASPKTHPADSSGQSAPSGMDTQFFEAVAAKIPWRQPRLALQWSGQRALNPQVRNNEFCPAWRKKVEFAAKSPLGDKWPTVFCSCIEFLTLLQAKKQHHLGHLSIS